MNTLPKFLLPLLALAVLLTTFAVQADDPYLVQIVVHDRSTTPIKVMEIWSDNTTVVRIIAPGEREDQKCGKQAHCESNTVHCATLSQPSAGATCHYCTSGTANDNFCWEVTGVVCSTLPGEDFTCGDRYESTCVAPPGGGANTCTGGTLLDTCDLEGCA